MGEPIPAQKAPYKMSVQQGRTYYWCACGRSAKQPLCDGSHKKHGLAPIAYQPKTDGDVWFCGCKSSGKRPLCDGTHNKL